MTIRNDWQVGFTAEGNPRVTVYGAEWRLMPDGPVFLHTRKGGSEWILFRDFDRLHSVAQDVEDTLRAAQSNFSS